MTVCVVKCKLVTSDYHELYRQKSNLSRASLLAGPVPKSDAVIGQRRYMTMTTSYSPPSVFTTLDSVNGENRPLCKLHCLSQLQSNLDTVAP